MNTLRQAAEDYLAVRRSLGFNLAVPGRQVQQFVDHLDTLGATKVTVDLAVAWATQPVGAAPYYHWLRLNAIRGFAGYLHGIDPAHQVPPADLLPRKYHRPTPYLLSAADIAALIDAASLLRPVLHAVTYRTLIGLLAVAGLRPSEALTLDISDVDLPAGVLTVHGKYGKTREILLHRGTIAELGDYTQLRDRMFPDRADTSFFVSVLGTRLNQRRVHYVFTRLAGQVGLRPRSRRCKAVPMSLRHSFAVATLITWYQDGVDVDAHMPLLSTWLGHVDPADTYWYVSAVPELLALAAERMTRIYGTPQGDAMSRLAPILQGFFTAKLITQRHASPHTISAYRDTWRLLLTFAQQATGTAPWKLDLGQLDQGVITAFLHYLEVDRHNGPSTRNARLAAIHSMFRYAALHAPDDAATIQRVLAIQGCHTTRIDINWLTDAEADALLAACDRTTWIGRRDHATILTGLRTGLRVSELTHLTCDDVRLDTAAHVRCRGKGRKERCTPLDKPTVTVLRDWLTERAGQPTDPLFPTRRGQCMSRDTFQARLTKYKPIAARTCPSLAIKNLAPHILRHTTAMALKRAGVDISVIALWLGHEDIASTQIYIHADLELKERALARTRPSDIPSGRYQAPDQLLAYLESL